MEVAPKRTMTEEHKKALKEGREAAAARRRAEQEGPDGLVRTNSAEIRAAKKNGHTNGLDAIAERHAHRNSDDELPTPEQIAARTQVYNSDLEEYTADDDIPADEPNPRDRDGATVGPIETLRDDSDDELRTLADLMNEYGQAIKLGTAYIHVDRKFPMVFEHQRIKGVQTPIREQMTQEDFNNFYGHGKYELIVYGPSARGGYQWDAETGALRYRKLTKPVTIEVPAGYPVNPAAMYQEEEEYEDEMQHHDPALGMMRGGNRIPIARMRRTGATSADAEMHKTELTFEEKAEQRRVDLEREKKDEERKREREQDRTLQTLITQLNQSHEQQMEMMRHAHEQAMEQQRNFSEQQVQLMRADMERVRQDLEREKHSSKRSDGEVLVTSLGQTLGQILPAMQRNDTLTSDQRSEIERAAAADKERSDQRHRDELNRMNDQLRAAEDRARNLVESEQRRASTEAQELRRQCEDRVREVREQSDARVREVEARAQQTETSIRRDCEQRLSDLKSSYESRMQDLDRGHSSELRTKADNFEARLESIRGSHTAEITLRDNEIDRLRDELVTVRAEANKSLPERLEEQTVIAEALGYVKESEAGGEKDWKSMIPEIAMQLAQNVPGILETVKHTMDARQRMQQNQQHQARALPAVGATVVSGSPSPNGMASRPMPFATEEGPQFAFESEVASEPMYPHTSSGPSRRPVPMPTQQQPAPPAPPMYVQESVAPPAQQQPAPQQYASAPASVAPPPPQTPAQQQGAVTPAQVVEYSKIFTAAFEQGASPQEFTSDVVAQFGPNMVKAVTASISPEVIIEVLNDHDPSSALLRRNGQKFLKDVWKILSEVR